MFLYENHEMVRTASSPLSLISIFPAERDPPGGRAGGDGLLVYTWQGDNSLERILAGDRRTDYLYTEGQLSSVDHQRDGVNIKTSFQYNQGSVAFW